MRKKFEQQKYTFNDIARFCHDILVDENGNKTALWTYGTECIHS